ncbi:MAG: Zn-dependent alcohol dehydrogenase [Verrucomicrobiota bacterium]
MIIQARAAVADSKGSFTIEDIEVHPPKAGEVRVAIKASGVCHTDYDSLTWGYQHVLGHEGAGIVESVGEGVTHVKPGDKVLLNWAIPCHKCYQCQNGYQNICEVNSPVTGANPDDGAAHPEATQWNGAPLKRSFNIGTLSTHTVVKEQAVIPTEIDISFESACFVGCAVMTGYGSVVNSAKLQAGSSAVVLGTGAVGLSVIQGARISGAAKIIAVDVNQQRLDMAKQFGATHLVLADREDKGLMNASEKIKEMCNGRGADYAFECTGVPALGAAPLAMIRNAGTAVQVSGIEQTIEIDMNLFEWDKIYINPLYGKAMPEHDFPKLLELYGQGALKLDEMVTRTYPLDGLQQAIDDMMAGRNAKGVITFA